MSDNVERGTGKSSSEGIRNSLWMKTEWKHLLQRDAILVQLDS